MRPFLPDFRRRKGPELLRDPINPRPTNRWLPWLLLAATAVTTTLAGMRQGTPTGATDLAGLILSGMRFSVPVLLILGMHEMGHFWTGRAYGIHLRGPWFIPAPNLFGTFGAVIAMGGPVPSRIAILRVAMAGPLASFVLGALAYGWGLAHSTIIPLPEGGGGLLLGDSLLTHWLSVAVVGPVPVGYDILLHPTATAGWIGLFVTALNLLPMAQLDGGHVLYAAFPKGYPNGSKMTWLFLLLGGIWGWKGWLVWAAMGLFIGISFHPRPLLLEKRLAWPDRALIVAGILILILCFVPAPIEILG